MDHLGCCWSASSCAASTSSAASSVARFRRYQTVSALAATLGTAALLGGHHAVGAAGWLLAIGVREAAMLPTAGCRA
ncbi:MAG: hypothetical protein R3F29_10440 [Planctomycetota bacterium]